ncbi:MAG TPA: AsmA family protein, partial [Terriglobales bacterium]|nr:AsmA family protein [Terriglobales bacterium]
MRKWVIVAVVLLLLIGTAVFVALLNANALINRNKDYLLNQAQQALGRKVSVGDVEVTLFTGFGVRLHDFAMSDDPAFSSGDFIRAKDLQVNLKLLPLLRRQFQVKRMILHQPVITVIRNANKNYNFSTIGEKKPKAPRAKKEERAPAKEKSAPPAFFVSLVDISDGELHYRDRKDGGNLDLKKIDLKVKDFDFGRPFTVEMGVALFAPKQNLKLQSRVGPISANGDFRDTPVNGELQVDALDVSKVKEALPRLKRAVPKALDFNGVYTVKDLKFTGTLNHLSLKGAIEGTDGSLRFGQAFQKAPGIPLKVSADATYATDKVTIRQADIVLYTLALTGKGDMQLNGTPTMNLSINSKPFSLEGWQKIIPAMAAYQLGGKMELHANLRGKVGKGSAPAIQGAFTWADGRVQPPNFPKPLENINADVRFTGEHADIKQTTLNLGRSKILFSGAVERFSPLTLSYKLSTPEIWPADFQASLPEERKGDVLRDLNNDGKITVTSGQITYQGKLSSAAGTLHKIGYKNLVANLSLANKVADIRSLQASLLDGTLQGDAQYAFNEPVPRFTAATKLQGIDIHQLYENLKPKAEHDIRGRLNANVKVAGSGKEWKEIEPTLQGAGEAEVLQGALLNFNIAQGALSGITGVPGLSNMIISPQLRQKYPEIFDSKDTEFKEMKTVFNIADSRVNIKDLRIAATDYSVQGKGWVNFNRRIDFQSVLTLSQRLSADVADSTREVKFLFNNQNQLELPFSLSGKLPNVKPRPDSRYLGKMV